MQVLSKDSLRRLKWCLYETKIGAIPSKFTNERKLIPTEFSSQFIY